MFKTRQRLLLSTFCFTLLPAALFLPATSYANTEAPAFYPISGWDTRTINQGQASPICSIATEFNNGFIMQITGTSGSLKTININFRQNIFTPNQAVPVTVTIPGQKTVSFQAASPNPEMIVITLNSSDNYYNLLRSASAVDIAIDDNAFRFYLTNYSNSLSRLNTCLGLDRNVAMRSEPLRDAPSPKAQSDAKRANERYIKEENVEMSASATLLPVKPLDKSEAPKIEDSLSKRPSAPANSYSRRLAEEMRRDGAPDVDVPAAVVEKAVTPVDTVEIKPIDEMENTLKATDVAADKAEKAKPLSEYGDRIRVTHRQEVKIKADFSDAGAITDLPPKMAPHTQQPKAEDLPVANVKTPKALPPQQYKALEKLEKEVSGLKAENTALNMELEKLLRESEKERLEISSDNWNLEQATMRFNEAERQITRLGQQVQKERAQCAQEKAELELMLFDPQVTEQAQLARLSELEKKLNAAQKAMDDQRMEYEERLRTMGAQMHKTSTAR